MSRELASIFCLCLMPSEEIAFTARHGQKSTPTPKFLGKVKAYFASHIDIYFQISLIYAFIGCSQSKPNLIGSVKLHKTNRLNLCLRDIYNRRNNLQALALQKVASNSCRFVCWSSSSLPGFSSTHSLLFFLVHVKLT